MLISFKQNTKRQDDTDVNQSFAAEYKHLNCLVAFRKL